MVRFDECKKLTAIPPKGSQAITVTDLVGGEYVASHRYLYDFEA
jgi:hypothetical protein